MRPESLPAGRIVESKFFHAARFVACVDSDTDGQGELGDGPRPRVPSVWIERSWFAPHAAEHFSISPRAGRHASSHVGGFERRRAPRVMTRSKTARGRKFARRRTRA